MKLSIFRLGSAILVALVVFYAASAGTKKQNHLRWNAKALDEKGAFHFYSNHTHHDMAEDVAGDNFIRDDDDWAPLVGYWLGGINEDLRLLYRVTPKYGQIFTYSLDQSGTFIAATAIRFDKSKKEFRFFFSTINGVHIAKLDETGQLMTGTWIQNGRRFPLSMRRFHPSNNKNGGAVPRELRFLVDKIVTGDEDQIMEMVGFWSGYGYLNVETPDDPELVVIEIEKVADDLVEPKVFLPDESPLPSGIRSFVVGSKSDGEVVKIVLDDPLGGNAIFHGKLDGKNLTGTVTYDDTDYAPSLTLVWSEKRLDALRHEDDTE